MKFSVLLLLISVLTLNAHTYAQTDLSLDLKDVSLREVFDEIESSTDFIFFYNDKLDVDQTVSIRIKEKDIETLLRRLFRGTNLEYEIIDRQIVVRTVEPEPFLTMNPIQEEEQQGFEVTGTVTDENNQGIPGVNVYVKGTTIGTITDLDGKYTIRLDNPQSTLVFSFVGYGTREIPVNGRQEINVQLEPEAIGLEEVIAVGYGSQVKKSLSSSISSVDPEKLTSIPSPSFEGGLQGRAAGVQITTSSALAGSAIRVRIRGTSSASANSEPLYVIDGIPMESGAISSSQPGASIQEWNLQQAANTNVLASLNPSDIESIEILKDAAASAIYGSRGANGVVLITTKGGKAGETNINFSASLGLSDATHRIQLLNGPQYIELAQEAWVNSGLDPDRFWDLSGVLVDGLTEEEARNTNTDWVDEVLQIGRMQDYNFSVSGGSEKTQFFLSANLKDEESILKGNKYLRIGTRLNIEHQLTDRFRVGAKMMVSHVDDQQVPTSWAGGIGYVTDMLPIWPVYKEDGTYFRVNQYHPVAGIELRDINLKSNQILGTWFLKARILEGLNFRTELGTNLLFNDDFHYRDGRITSHDRTVSSTVIGESLSWNLKNILNYKKSFQGHNFDLLAASETQKYNRKVNSVFGDTYFNTALKKPEDAEIINAGYFETGYAFQSYIGRFNYDYQGKYLFSFSIRADGSSRFAEDNRWGYFPAGSVGYIISEENYFNPVKNLINFLKLRVSYGIVGNAEIGDYAYYSSYRTISYDGNTGIVLNNLGDDKLGWEQTAQLDVGLTWELFDGRIGGEFDYYNKKTTDLLLPFPVSQMTGVSQITKNVGELSNVGFDISINTFNIQSENFTWETNFTFNHNKNEVTSLSEEIGEGLTTSQGLASISIFKGYPVGVQEMVEWTGVDPATGEDQYLDAEGNELLYSELISQYGSFDNFWNENKKPMGNPWPVLTGGMDNRFTYRNWYLNMLFTYATGQDYWLGELKRTLAAFGATKVNPHDIVLDRWQEPGDDARVSQLTVQNISWATTTEHMARTDYLRLKDLTLGYRFDLKDTSPFKRINAYLKFTNLLTFTKAPDYLWDPEYAGVVQYREGNNLQALSDYKTAPQAKMYMLGLSFDF